MIEPVRCLSEDEAISLAAGASVGDGWIAHLDHCETCRQLVSMLAVEEGGLFPGQTIGRFVVTRPLGMGGMGVVYEADDPLLGRRVALKLLRLDARDRATALVRESRALAQLNHANVVTLYDVGHHGDELYLAMELAPGTLDEWLHTPRPWREALARFADAGRGLSAAHAIGLVHRDVKPANMLVGADGRVKIGDFGVVRAPDDDATGIAVGTPRYMAPEVRTGTPATQASDQWSLAMSIWRGLGGDVGVAPAHVPRRIVDVLRRGLAPDPADRWPSVDAMLRALEPRRRGVWILAAGGLAASVAAFAIGLSFRADAVVPCAELASSLDGIWPAPGLPAELARDVDRYATAWRGLRDRACRTSSLAPLQVACLARKRDGLREMLRLAPTQTPAQLRDSVEMLPPVDECEDAEHLVRAVPPPTDPVLRRSVAAGEAELTAAEARWMAAQDQGVVAIARRIATAPHAPLRGRALRVVALVQMARVEPAVVTTLHEAATAAAESGDVVLQAQVALLLVDSHAIVPQAIEDREWRLREAEARITAIERFAPETAARLRQGLLRNRALFALERHDTAAAVVSARACATLADRLYGPASWHAARARSFLAVALTYDAQFLAALSMLLHAAPIVAKQVGADHPDMASHLRQIAVAYHFLGDDPQALTYLHAAAAIAEPVALQATNLDLEADVVMTMGRFAEGARLIERGLAMTKGAPPTADRARSEARLSCARRAIAATTNVARMDVARCFLGQHRAPVAVTILERIVGEPVSASAIRARFALAQALADRGRIGDEPRAIIEANRALAACTHVRDTREVAREIASWLARVTE